MQGDLYLGGFAIKGVGEPSLSTDAATKAYVDSKGGGGGSFQTKYDGNRFCKVKMLCPVPSLRVVK